MFCDIACYLVSTSLSVILGSSQGGTNNYTESCPKIKNVKFPACGDGSERKGALTFLLLISSFQTIVALKT